MRTEIKKEFKKIASKNPKLYYAVDFLKKKGFKRGQCKKCQTYYWSLNEREVCGDANCCGGFDFFEDNPCKVKLNYVETWNSFKKHMAGKGYTAIDRYPVVARWRDDTDFVQASIYDFQPYVVTGEVEPPANPLVVPQFCLRFNDIDNVGVTMSHFTGFVMIGQHAFLPKEEWDLQKNFEDLYTFFTDVLGIADEELIMHEDAWAGGGNLGPCMEIFSRGAELANQVYMLYEVGEDGQKELKLKVLDMGMGHERVCWFTQGKKSAYDAVFPKVMEKLYARSGVKVNDEFFSKYVKYAPFLNLDETDDIEKAWKELSKESGLSSAEIKEHLPKMSALYSIAEHTRSLLFAISDGALPSNVKGGYNLRVILRRALGFIDKYKWDLTLKEIALWHAEELAKIFPELKKNVKHVSLILDVETAKFKENKERNKKIIQRTSEKPITKEVLLTLYDSYGIDPEEIKKEAGLKGIEIEVPENFYKLVSERHENQTETSTTKDVIKGFENLENTTPLYFDHYDLLDFSGHVLKVQGNYVCLNQTAFYPTSGGQLHDTGIINDCKVVDVIKQNGLIIHKLDKVTFKEGDKVFGKVDYDRREQLTQHHTATHILTGSVRRLLGDHVWQAGAAKTLEKARLDITHFEQLSKQTINDIEKLARDVISENRPVYKEFMPRSKAESAYGIRIYQGGAVPGRELRIVNIEGFDVEACAGTHVDVTGDVYNLKIVKTSKLQDGIVRIEFVAGKACQKMIDMEKEILDSAKKILECQEDLIVGRAKELFDKWKKARKNKLDKFKFESKEVVEEDVIRNTAEVLKTQPEHIIKTLKRFKEEIKQKTK